MLKVFRWTIAQFFELNWWKTYLRNQSVDDYLAWKRKYWKDFLVSIELSEFEFSNDNIALLDVGCGPAGIFCIFPNKSITAVDPLIHKYQAELPHFKKINYPKVNFVQSSLEEFYSNFNYDVVFCINCINHVLDIQKSIQKLSALCKQGAMLVISTDVHHNNLLKSVFKVIPGDILHPHQYNKKEYVELLENGGFQMINEYQLKHERIFDYWVFVMKKI